MTYYQDCAGAHHAEFDSPITPPLTHRVTDLSTPADGLTLLTGKPYTPAAQTDVQKTWRKFGWTPRGETTPPLTWPVINLD